MCKLLKIKLNTPANVHPPVVVGVVVVVVRFVLCRFLSSGHAAYSRSPSFVSLLLMLHHKHTKLGVFRLSLSLSICFPCVRSLVAWRPVSLSAMLLVLTFTKQQAKWNEHKIGSTLVNFCFFCTHFSFSHCFTWLRHEYLLIISALPLSFAPAVSKSNSVDLYRPPALRNSSSEEATTTTGASSETLTESSGTAIVTTTEQSEETTAITTDTSITTSDDRKRSPNR